MAAIKMDLIERLEAWMKKTDDPLLNGPVAPPKGALINDADGMSHREEGIQY